jgi:SAM-dependent methyltransferase
MPNKSLMRKLKKIDISRKEYGPYETIVRNFLDIKAKSIYNRIGGNVVGKKILDIGTGVGGIAADLSERGFEVVSVDIDDASLVNGFPSEIYNGHKLPFADREFDTALLVHVLHHCADGLEVLKEAKRVAKRVIFIEDTYRSTFERSLVSLFDMLGNSEFYDHDYKTKEEWENIIKDNNWKITNCAVYSELTYGYLYGRYVFFVIE